MYYQITVDCVIKSSRMLSLRGFDCLFLDLCRSQQSDFVLFGQEVLCGHFPPCVVVRVQRSLVFAPWLAGCPLGLGFLCTQFWFLHLSWSSPSCVAGHLDVPSSLPDSWGVASSVLLPFSCCVCLLPLFAKCSLFFAFAETHCLMSN